jgi:acylphosphatase
MREARHLRIEGRVQGVFYRQWMVETARGLGLHGWVRNRRDGSVEAVVSGSGEAVAAMLAACHHGPLRAVVTAVAADDWKDPVDEGFRKLPTA